MCTSTILEQDLYQGESEMNIFTSLAKSDIMAEIQTGVLGEVKVARLPRGRLIDSE